MHPPYRLPANLTAEAGPYLARLELKREAARAIAAGLRTYLEGRYAEEIAGGRIPHATKKAARLEAAERISKGLEILLTVDLDAEIENVRNPPPHNPMLYGPSPEQLITAQEAVERLEEQKATVEEQINSLPEYVRESIAPMLKVGIATMIEPGLREAIAYRDRLQKALESAAPEPPPETSPAAERCPDCEAAKRQAWSDATTPGFMHPYCEKHRPPETSPAAEPDPRDAMRRVESGN